MKKVSLAIILVICMVLGSAVLVRAESGFHIDLGYEQLNNSFTLNPALSIPIDLTLDINMPCKMYTIDLGYDFDDNFGIEGLYSWGSSDVVKVNGNISGTGFDLPVSMDNTVWRVEGVYKFPVGDGFKIGALLGYLDSDSKLNGSLSAAGTTVNGEIKQKYQGMYIGVLGMFNPTENIEFGAAFRYLISPTGNVNISLAENGSPNLISPNSVSMNDFSVYFFDIYGKAAITPNWSIQAGYTYTYADYSLSIPNTYVTGADVTNKTSGLWVKMAYKF